ncbi:MAG: site-specific integrase, partial [Deltaproteobacteria bacterium]|nr:site-specific integrase [Deltaproteobacteria bacterium]
MAFVYEKNGKWFLRYKTIDGRWVSKSSEARTKTEAKLLASEMARQVEQEKIGLRQPGSGLIVRELLQWWLDEYSSQLASHQRNIYAIKAHIFPHTIAKVPLRELTPGHIERLLQEKSKSHSPQTVNHLRKYFLISFNCARRAGKFTGPNPAQDVRARKVPRRMYDYLKAGEVPRVLQALNPTARPLFAAAIYTGLRKGELFGLRKIDVDLQRGLLTVARSHDRDTTKGGHADVIPIAAELVPFMERAIEDSPSELVFPNEAGELRRDDSKLAKMLRGALARAGIVQGYEHVCRRSGCKHREKQADATIRRCSKCNMKLWPKALVRPIRFHDLRHTCASLMMMAGANPAAVQRIMRHSNPRMTTEVYGHLAPDYLKDEANRLKLLGDGSLVTLMLPARKNAAESENSKTETADAAEGCGGAPAGIRTQDPRLR